MMIPFLQKIRYVNEEVLEIKIVKVKHFCALQCSLKVKYKN